MIYDENGQAEFPSRPITTIVDADLRRFSLKAAFALPGSEEFAAQPTFAQPLEAGRRAGTNRGLGTREMSDIASDRRHVPEIPLNAQAILGRRSLTVSQALGLKPGAVVQLDRRIGEPLEIEVNGKVIALGEIVVMDEVSGHYGLKIIEVKI